MDRPGSEAVGIGAKAHVTKICVICQRRALETGFGGAPCGAPCSSDPEELAAVDCFVIVVW